MEGCLLCFQNHKEYVGCIQANSTHWMELNVHTIIEKHLWPIECIQPYSWICNICWKALFEFNNFYMMINERHHKRLARHKPMVIDSLTDAKPLIQSQYESEIFIEENVPATTQGNTTNTADIEKMKNLPAVIEIEKLYENQAIKLESIINNQENFNIDLTNEEIDANEKEPYQDVIFINENVNCDGQKNDSLCNNQTPFITNMEEEDLIAHVIFANPTKGKRGRPCKIPTRGRPRKNSTKGVPKSNNTPVNSKNNLGRPAKNTEKYIQHKKRLWENRSISRPIRKRKLPCKFLTNSGEGTNSLKNRKLYAFISTGKRGRPRKVLIPNISNEQNAPNELVIADTKQYQELCNNNIPTKPKAKRGRPRKIFKNNLEIKLEQVDNICDNTVSSSYENNTSLIPKNKPGRPRKDAAKHTLTISPKKELWTDRMCSRPKRKLKLPRKYFADGIQVTTEDSENETISTDKPEPLIKPELLCENNKPSNNTGKRGRPKKHLTNEIDGTENNETVRSETSLIKVKTVPSTKRIISKLKHRKPVRHYKDLMRNYIATSVRCMQIFKHKNTPKSDTTKAVDGL